MVIKIIPLHPKKIRGKIHNYLRMQGNRNVVAVSRVELKSGSCVVPFMTAVGVWEGLVSSF